MQEEQFDLPVQRCWALKQSSVSEEIQAGMLIRGMKSTGELGT